MPTVYRERGYRFFFWSNERNEPPHVHVESGDGYAKFWLAPVAVAESLRFDASEIRELLRIVSEQREMFESVWHGYFGT